MCLNSFTQQPYCDLPECFAGWMARQRPQSGEVFEARTVRDRIDVASDTTVCIPVVIDLEDRQVVWADIALEEPGWINNVHANRDNIARLAGRSSGWTGRTCTTCSSCTPRPGAPCPPGSEADTVFSVHEGITPFDTDRILSEFLA